jgi:hypothetical protein
VRDIAEMASLQIHLENSEQVCPAVCVKGGGAMRLKIFGSAGSWNNVLLLEALITCLHGYYSQGVD